MCGYGIAGGCFTDIELHRSKITTGYMPQSLAGYLRTSQPLGAL